jgi:hypothetical protein
LLFVKLYGILFFIVTRKNGGFINMKKIKTLLMGLLMSVTLFLTSVQAATTEYKFADINVSAAVPNDLAVFTRSVTSNNANLDLLGVDNVEELRALMKINNVYLEAVPSDVSYELIISGKDTTSADLNTLSDSDLDSIFKDYIAASDNIDNDSVTEKVTGSSIQKEDNAVYFVTDVTSVSNNDITIYMKKYYTVMQGKAVSFSIQSNGQALTEEMQQILLDVVRSAEYKTIHKSIFENEYVSEILATFITLAVPIAILALVTYFITKSKTKSKKQIEADEARLRAEYAQREKEKEESGV